MKMRIIFLLILCFFLLMPCCLFSEEEGEAESEEWALYAQALEYLVQENDEKALEVFREFIEKYPSSKLRPKVEEYIQTLENTLDHSAIVSFYIMQLLTTSYIGITVPQLFDVDMDTDSFVYGIAGIVGVGCGLGSAWLMTRDGNMSLGQNLWIENLMACTLVNYNLIRTVFVEEPEYEDKLYLTGQLLLMGASRTGSYFLVRDQLPSAGRASFFTWSYAWAHFYTWLTTLGIFQSEDLTLNSTLGLIIPDLLGVGSYFLWDHLHWSFERNGLISIAGIGGGILGACINLILNSIVEDPDERGAMGILLASTCAGTGLGVALTSKMKPDSSVALDESPETPEKDIAFFLSPSRDGKGIGCTVIYSY
jgi:hypothetical protein